MVVKVRTRVKRSKTDSSASSGMPDPASLTVSRTPLSSRSPTSVILPPRGVYLRAFETGLPSTWRIWLWSKCVFQPIVDGCFRRSWTAFQTNVSAASAITTAKLPGLGATASFPASTLAMSTGVADKPPHPGDAAPDAHGLGERARARLVSLRALRKHLRAEHDPTQHVAQVVCDDRQEVVPVDHGLVGADALRAQRAVGGFPLQRHESHRRQADLVAANFIGRRCVCMVDAGHPPTGRAWARVAAVSCGPSKPGRPFG